MEMTSFSDKAVPVSDLTAVKVGSDIVGSLDKIPDYQCIAVQTYVDKHLSFLLCSDSYTAAVEECLGCLRQANYSAAAANHLEVSGEIYDIGKDIVKVLTEILMYIQRVQKKAVDIAGCIQLAVLYAVENSGEDSKEKLKEAEEAVSDLEMNSDDLTKRMTDVGKKINDLLDTVMRDEKKALAKTGAFKSVLKKKPKHAIGNGKEVYVANLSRCQEGLRQVNCFVEENQLFWQTLEGNFKLKDELSGAMGKLEPKCLRELLESGAWKYQLHTSICGCVAIKELMKPYEVAMQKSREDFSGVLVECPDPYTARYFLPRIIENPTLKITPAEKSKCYQEIQNSAGSSCTLL